MVTPRLETLSRNTFSKSELGDSVTVNHFAENSKDDGVGALMAKESYAGIRLTGAERGVASEEPAISEVLRFFRGDRSWPIEKLEVTEMTPVRTMEHLGRLRGTQGTAAATLPVGCYFPSHLIYGTGWSG